MNGSSYDKFPAVIVPHGGKDCVSGWDAIAARLRDAVATRDAATTVLTVECYPGVDEGEVRRELAVRLRPKLALSASAALRPVAEVEALVAPFLGGDDPVFGFISGLDLPEFFAPGEIARLRWEVEQVGQGLILLVGCGARLIHEGDVLVYADLTRREAQLRFRRKEAGNFGAANPTISANLQYKRAFFVDWRVADRWKRALIACWNFVLDTHHPAEPKLATGEGVRRGLRHAATRPFRVVPYFDPAPWGGQWLREACGLDRGSPNYGWGFDCVPEENSLLLDFGGTRLEMPSLNIVFYQARALLGAPVHARFGAEFPIRVDFLDTMAGGNLSLQVHPRIDYIRKKFGMAYTQDESYYLLEAGPAANIYLGLKEGIDPAAMTRDLRAAQAGGAPFSAAHYANQFSAKKHDHFLIPAGTVHCAGAGTVVLEISATPYIFTFKLWDWGRLGLDGRPRPIHLEHGLANIDWSHTTEWVRRNLISRCQPVARGAGWREERTGLYETQFIETRRHWFTGPVPHDTGGQDLGSVNVLNLVEGEAAVVESPAGAFAPFPVRFAETFIVPAAVGHYIIRPTHVSAAVEHATIKAGVRITSAFWDLETKAGPSAAACPSRAIRPND